MSTARTQHRHRRQRGHSLLEAMLAGSVLLAGLTGVVSALSSGMQINAHTSRVAVATLVAERSLERLLLLPATHTDLSTTVTHTGTSFGLSGSPETGGALTPTWTVSGGPIEGSLRIDLTVTWTERHGARSVQLTTFR